MSLIPSPSLSPKESVLLVLLFLPHWSRVVPLHSWVLLEVLGIFFGFDFCPRSSILVTWNPEHPPFPPLPPPGRGYLPIIGIQIIEKPEKLGSRNCCLPDEIVIKKKYDKRKLSIDHSHLLGKIKGLQTNKVISNNQHNYKKIKMSRSKKWAH